MTLEILTKYKRFFVLSLAVMVLFSYLFYNDDDTIVSDRLHPSAHAVITGKLTETNQIETVDEINAVVFHAVIMRSITNRQMIRLLRVWLIPVLTALIACYLRPHSYQSRIILIRYIHRSDGKK